MVVSFFVRSNPSTGSGRAGAGGAIFVGTSYHHAEHGDNKSQESQTHAGILARNSPHRVQGRALVGCRGKALAY